MTWPRSRCMRASLREERGGAWEVQGELPIPPSRPLPAMQLIGEGREGAGHTHQGIFHSLVHSFNKYLASSSLLTSFYQFWIISSHSLLKWFPTPFSLASLSETPNKCITKLPESSHSHFSLFGIFYIFVSLCCSSGSFLLISH